MGDAASEPPETVCRVGVFVDWQNCYRNARDAFGFQGPGVDGNVKPLLMAKALATVRAEGHAKGQLTKLRIYTGRASQQHDKRTYAANRRQFQAWWNSDPATVEVIARTLDYKLGRPREKGIDVKLSIDLVRASLIDNEHDVAIVVSADTDLLPALELLVEERGAAFVEVATWTGPHWSPAPLSLAGHRIKQHKMTKAFYDKVADTVDYGAEPGGGRRSTLKGPGQYPRYPYGRKPRGT